MKFIDNLCFGYSIDVLMNCNVIPLDMSISRLYL
jgi:hypothetical protein